MNRKEGLILGLDYGSSSLGTGVIDMNKKNIHSATSNVWEHNTCVERNEVRRTRRSYIHRSDRNTRLLRVLHTCGCLPEKFCSYFNWEPTAGDRGIGTLKKSLNKMTDYPNLIECAEYDESYMRMKQWFLENRPEVKPVVRGWLPKWLAMWGMSHKLSDYEFALVLIYMSKKRGVDWLDSTKNSKWMQEFRKVNGEVKQSGLTPFDVELWKLDNMEKTSLGTLSRSFYMDALDKLLTEQEKYKDWLCSRDVLEIVVKDMYRNNVAHREKRLSKNMNLKKFIIDDVIMFQRRGNQKSKIKKCPYEKKIINGIVYSERCICKSHPLYVSFVSWSTVNNIEFRDKKSGDLLEFNRESVYNYLYETEEPKITGLMKAAGVKSCTCNYDSKTKKLPENRCVGKMFSVLRDSGLKDVTYDKLEELWNIIYSAEGYSERMSGLKKFSRKNRLDWPVFSDRIAEVGVMSVGYGAMSKKLLQKIMPYIISGQRYNEVVKELYDKDIIPHCDNLEELREQFEEDCRNGNIKPHMLAAAQHTFNSLYKCLESFGGYLPEYIMCEGMNEIADTEERKKKYIEKLTERRNYKKLKNEILSIQKVNSNRLNMDKITVLLDFCCNYYKEVKDTRDSIYKITGNSYRNAVYNFIKLIDNKCAYICPYTGQKMTISELFDENNEREHILAHCKTMENGVNNFVIADHNTNQLKGNMTPVEFIKKYGGTHGIRTWKEYEDAVKKEYKYDDDKKKRLLSSDYEYGFKQYQKQMTMELGKYFQTLLCSLYSDSENPMMNRVINVPSKVVFLIKNEITNIYQKYLDTFVKPRLRYLDSLPAENKKNGCQNYLVKTEKGESIEIDEPKRMDYRHHAMDALCCAMASRKLMCIISESAKRGFSYNEKGLFGKLNAWEGIEDDIVKFLKGVEVRFINKRVRSRVKRGLYKKYDNNGNVVYEKTKAHRVVKRKLYNDGIYSKKNDLFTINKPIVGLLDTKELDKEREKCIGVNGVLTAEVRDKIVGKVRKEMEEHFKLPDNIIDVMVLWVEKNIDKKSLKDIFSADGISEMNSKMEELCSHFGHKKHNPIKRVKVISKGDRKYSLDRNGESKKYVIRAKGLNVYAVVVENVKINKRAMFIGDGDGKLFDEEKYNSFINKGYEVVCEMRIGDCIRTDVGLMRIVSFDETAGDKGKIHCVVNNWQNIEMGELQKRKTKTYSINNISVVDFVNKENVVSSYKSYNYSI